jgi:ferredoxin
MSETISRLALVEAASVWIAAGMRVAGPRRIGQRVFYSPVATPSELLLAPSKPANSIKELFFPRHEKLYGYRITSAGIELFDDEVPAAPQVIVAARPCDAAALPVLDHVFNWDYPDRFWFARREAATVVTFACREWDDECFCTSVGLGPEATRGSDVLLVPTDDEAVFEVRTVTGKGRTLLEGRTQPSTVELSAAPGPERRFDPIVAGAFARERFDDPFWHSAALACIGCGACAYTCPTCHCFDIADEGANGRGERVRNWDSCQFGMFTLHASGHNPRPDQGARQRQRIYHKFHMYPEKFGEMLCTGCGNCARNCPAGLGVLLLASEIGNGKYL